MGPQWVMHPLGHGRIGICSRVSVSVAPSSNAALHDGEGQDVKEPDDGQHDLHEELLGGVEEGPVEGAAEQDPLLDPWVGVVRL